MQGLREFRVWSRRASGLTCFFRDSRAWCPGGFIKSLVLSADGIL